MRRTRTGELSLRTFGTNGAFWAEDAVAVVGWFDSLEEVFFCLIC